MFNSLSERLTSALKTLSGRGRLTEDNISDSLREVRKALLEADVALPVITTFIEDIRTKAVGQEVAKSLKPGETLIKIVSDELIHILGDTTAELNLQAQPPVVILMVGLQGSGKTTTSAKLARLLQEQKKSVMLTSVDVYRPAAIHQLELLATQIEAKFHPSNLNEKPLTIAKQAVLEAKKQFADVLIIDTAGRLHVDDALMNELVEIQAATQPTETLFVVDSMTGQDAANTAKVFNERLTLTGIILTKTDGDSRGGAALSMRQLTGKPIKFIGVGEKIDAFEVFHPERIASRILGMGDIVSLVEEATRKVDHEKAEKMAKKLAKGKNFDLEDFLMQLQQMKSMGGMTSLLGKLPGMGQLPANVKAGVNDKMFSKMEAIIHSMTKKERRSPQIINGSRKRRIAIGSGNQIQDVNRLLKQFTQMQKMFKKIKGGGLQKMMGKVKSMMPPGGGKFPF